MLHLVELQPNFYQYSKFNPGNWMNQDIVSNAIKINAYVRCIYDMSPLVSLLVFES